MFALLKAVRNKIRTGSTATGCLTYNDKDCDIGPASGQPPPTMKAPFYVCVHEGKIDPALNYSLFDEYYTVHVTVSIKLRGTPWDRIVQKELYGNDTTNPSLDLRCRQIAALIHTDTVDLNISRAANALSELAAPGVGYAKQGFFEPLRYAGMDQAQERGPAWFHTDISKPENYDLVGFSKTIRFTGARRAQETMFAEAIGVIT